ncbi:hypothetical protein GCM10022276_16470 [Sphingomonas limnosediminicola]|uniref:Uncharacterized protein n=1 Tax=Sphingomonas limnosediminicola TaxID=940133 RepID=A0ABP7LCN7_9SPHN
MAQHRRQLRLIDRNRLSNDRGQRRREWLFRIGAASRLDVAHQAARLLQWRSGEAHRYRIEAAFDRWRSDYLGGG